MVYVFYTKANLIDFHDKMSLSCLQCKKDFTLKSNLTRHLRMVHNLDIQRIDILPADFDVYQYKCLEGCKISFKYNRELRSHLRLRHEKELIELNLEFPNSQEFTKWLHNEETENCVQYVHMTAMKKKSTGVQTYYYECSRSGKRSHIDDNIRKRKLKKQGTLKLNRGCTSQIIANQFVDGTYNVNYFKTHYGHDNEIEHLKLSKRERGAIASKLLLGIPITTVLNSVQSNKSGSLKRINLLRRKDVSNIKRSFNIDVKDSNSTTNTNIKINTFIEECNQNEFDPILYSNLKDISALDEICLMLLTKWQAEILQTFTKNNTLIIETVTLDNCDFELTILFLIFNINEIFPVACMFSTNKDLYTYELFFNKIHEKVGQLSPGILCCNVDKIYYEAWRIVMGDVNHIFYNPTQVDLDWKLMLNRIVCNDLMETKCQRDWMYNTLKVLENTVDENDFFDLFEETVKVLNNDQEFKNFLNCFLETYNDPKRWANCYKQNLNINGNHFEIITQLLNDYIEKTARFDRVFYSLTRLIRNETINYLQKHIGNEVLLAEIDSQHNLHVDNDNTAAYNFKKLTTNTWNVIVDNTTYIIERHSKKICCDLICNTCKICTHCFSCTCCDYFINNRICTHIHQLWMTYFHGNDTVDDDDDKNNNDHNDSMTVDDGSQSEEIIIKIDNDDDDDFEEDDEDDDPDIDKLQQEVVEKADILCSNLHNVQCKDSLKFIVGTLTNLCDIVMKDEDSYNIEEESVIAESLNDSVKIDHSYL